MSRLKILSVIVIVVIMVAILWSVSPIFLGGREGTGKVVWVNYDAGWTAARRFNRPVMLFFHSTTCPACKLMEANVFKNEEIVVFLNKNFIPVYISVDEPAGINLAKKYKVLTLPTVIFLTPGRVELERIIGYWPPERFQDVAERVLENFKALG